MSKRSRRETGAPSNYDEEHTSEMHQESKKRKPPMGQIDATGNKALQTVDGKPGSLSWTLSSEKSPICKVDMSKIINGDTWFCLSSEDKEALSMLLPPTVYPFFEVPLPSYHPSRRGDTISFAEQVVPALGIDGVEAEPSSFLSCPYFEAGQVTFQDHLYSGWYGKRHINDVRKYQSGVIEGTKHAPWKDEVWEAEQRREEENESNGQATGFPRQRNSLDGMVSHGLVQDRDILVYKRFFPDLNTSVEKDVLILYARTGGITVVAPAKDGTLLPLGMLVSNPNPPTDGSLQQMTVQTLEELESVILDMNGQVSHDRRPGGNTWKRFTVWKWRGELEQQFEAFGSGGIGNLLGPRGPREKRGTFFYLRGAYLPQK